jgi:thymidylate synthase ThyX
MTTQTSAKIIADSVSPANHRLTTFECTFPRIILAEVNTHKMLSKNSASSRAIPVEKMIARVLEDSYVPTHWGKNQRGMQAEQDVSPDTGKFAEIEWEAARDAAVEQAARLLKLGIHKQITNRLLEPFMWHTALITGTEWSNFFHLRDNKDAHPDFRDLAHAMRELYEKRQPRKLCHGEWHKPLIEDNELAHEFCRTPFDVTHLLCKVSVGRCARISYLTHDGKRDPQADVDLCVRLLSRGHMSPFEHVARPMTEEELELFKQKKLTWDAGARAWTWLGRHDTRLEGDYTHFLGNLNGWVQYRKLIAHEEDILGACAREGGTL